MLMAWVCSAAAEMRLVSSTNGLLHVHAGQALAGRQADASEAGQAHGGEYLLAACLLVSI